MRKQKAKKKGKGVEKVTKTLHALFILARPVNAILSLIAVLVGALMSCGISCINTAVLAGLAAAFISAGGQAINDAFDVVVDREKTQKKPIPAGWISAKSAKAYAFALFALGLIFAALVSSIHALLALVAVVSLFLYSWRIQRRKYVGNVLVSFFVALLFVFGGLCGGRWYATLIPAYLAFLATWGREIWKDVEDFEADRGIKTSLAHILTPRFASYFASYLVLLAVMLSPLPSPLGFGFLSWTYLYVVLLADIIFLLSAYLGVSGNVVWAERGAKAGMLVATAAMLAGALI